MAAVEAEGAAAALAFSGPTAVTVTTVVTAATATATREAKVRKAVDVACTHGSLVRRSGTFPVM
jgi:hypothetical protein